MWSWRGFLELWLARALLTYEIILPETSFKVKKMNNEDNKLVNAAGCFRLISLFVLTG